MKRIIAFVVVLLLISTQSLNASGRKIFLDNIAVWDTIAGITFQQSSFGKATGTYDERNNLYQVEAELFNIPTLPAWYFYQGWVVDTTKTSYIPAGEIFFGVTTSKTRLNETLKFSAVKDLRNHSNYALSVEKGNIELKPRIENIVLEGRMDFRLIRSVSAGSSFQGSKNLSTDEKLDKLKEKASSVSTFSSVMAAKKFNDPTIKKTNVSTVASIIGPRIQTPQQELLLKRLSSVSKSKLLQVKFALPAIKNKFRDIDASVKDRSAKIRLINDIELVIDYLTQ